MYLLNLRFSVAKSDGLFADYSTSDDLWRRSKTWLQLKGEEPINPVTFNPIGKGVEWNDLGGDGTVLLSRAKAGTIGVHIVPETPSTSNMLRSSIVFGKRDTNQAFASPFTLDDKVGGPSCTMFTSEFLSAQLMDGSWYFPLRSIAVAPSSGGLVYSFGFIAAAMVADGDGATMKLYSFSHDPRMDVVP